MSAAQAFGRPMLTLLLVCAALSAAGFYKYVYFLSVGYGLAIAGEGAALIALFTKMPWGCLLLCLLLLAYGIRLAGFLLARELGSAAYRHTLRETAGTQKPMPLFVKAAIWVCVSLLYAAQASPVYVRLYNGAGQDTAVFCGAAVMAAALWVETAADAQKSRSKTRNPGRFCDTGLYKYVRCPNYFGEILFWTGVLISGLSTLRGAWQWAGALTGYLVLLYVMLSGAKRLEIRQDEHYAQDDAYRAYTEKTPLLLPLVPLYHLRDAKFIK